MARDYYEEAFQIADALDEQGQGGAAATLRDAIESGSIGTEILMALKVEFERIEKNGRADPMTIERVRDLRAAIATALQQ